MTINTTKDPRSDTKSDAVSEPAITSKTQPRIVVPSASDEPDLESRIRVRRAELTAKLGELKTDMRLEAAEARDKVKAKLSELTHVLKWGVVDGWASLGDNLKNKLETWLGDSRGLLPAQDAPARTEQS